MVGKETLDSVDEQLLNETETPENGIPSEEEIEGMFSEVDKEDDGEDKVIRNKDARNWSLTHLAHRGMMMDKIMRQNKIVENTVKGLQNESGIDTENLDEEEMGVNIGNESTTKNYYVEQAAPVVPPQAPQVIVQPPPQPQAPPKPEKTNWLPASILAAGALTGAGLLYSKDTPEVPPAQPPVVRPETDYDIGVGFGTPTPINEETTRGSSVPTLQPLKDNNPTE